MRRADAIALGLLQGPVELLPISSSAHIGLALRGRLTGAERKELEVALHAGTAVALALYERNTLRWGLLVAATAPPALAGLVFERPIEERLGTPRTIAAGLVLGSIAMVLADRTPVRRVEATARDGLALGAAQALALIPGVSRSGATLVAGRLRGFDRLSAAALSREVALPVLAGAATLKGWRLIARRPEREELVHLGLAAGAALASTTAALKIGRRTRYEPPMVVWAAYRTALAALIVARDRDRALMRVR
jgi:undecaprenyl-diphosphatase